MIWLGGPTAGSVCGYTESCDEENPCGQVAVIHVMLRNREMTLACQTHRYAALVLMPVDEWHEIGTWCNMPGSLWQRATRPGGTDGWCELDGCEISDCKSMAEAVA